jgi:hypothetical protein
MKEIGLWGGQGTNHPPGPEKSDVVAYCLVSVPHREQVLTTQRLLRVCAVRRRRFPVGVRPARRPLQPEATGAAMEVTK